MAETLRAFGGERAVLESVIERSLPSALQGLTAVSEVGAALARIHDEHLFAQRTFGQYLEARWLTRLSRTRAYQLIGASRVVSTVVDAGLSPPESERVARELAPLLADPTELTATWLEVQSEHPNGATHKEVAHVRERRKAAKSVGVVGVKGTTGADEVLADDDREFMENTSKAARLLYDIETLADDTSGLDDEFVQRFIACHFEGTPEVTLRRKEIDGLIAFLRLVRPYGRT